MKRLLVIAYGRLITNGSAGHTVMCGLVEAAVAAGWDVTFLGLLTDGYAGVGDIPSPVLQNPRVMALEARYAVRRPASFQEKIQALIEPGMLESIQGALPVLEPSFDRIIAFDSLPRSLAETVSATTKVLIFGDPVGERLQHSSAPASPPWSWFGTSKTGVLGKFLSLIEPSCHRKALTRETRPAMFGTGHAKTWSAAFGCSVIDLRPFIPVHSALPEYRPDPDRITLSFGGTLGGTASRNSMTFLFDHLIPALSTKEDCSGSPAVRGAQGKLAHHQLQIVGSVPAALKERLEPLPHVTMPGRVPDFEATLADVDLFLVPMDYPVGVRTRVCSALQAGCFCVCHASILYNMPELRSCPAVRIAEDNRGILDAIAAYPLCVEDRHALRREARTFFERHYRAGVSAAPLLQENI